jgi:predicted glycosyltransferase
MKALIIKFSYPPIIRPITLDSAYVKTHKKIERPTQWILEFENRGK